MPLWSDFPDEVGKSNDKFSWLHHEEGKSFQYEFREELFDCLMQQAFERRRQSF